MHETEVTTALMAALEREPRVNLHRDQIRVQYDAGVATLSGEVADIAAKRLTLELAAALPAVTGIIDRLHTRPAEPMGDGAIADHLQRALTRDSSFDDCGIYRTVGDVRTAVRETASGPPSWWLEFRVEEGVVTLDGDVPSLSHKRLAGALAWWIPGSRDVINGLGVEPPEEDSDDEILDALRLVFDKDPLLDATQIRASSVHSVVTLQGVVTSDAQKHMADFDAWAIFGVDKVVNRIEVSPA